MMVESLVHVSECRCNPQEDKAPDELQYFVVVKLKTCEWKVLMIMKHSVSCTHMDL